MGRQIEELAGFVTATRWEDIPEAVQRHAKITLLDTLGVILAGSERPEVQQLRARLAGSGIGGATVYARGFPNAEPRTAAMLNGIAGRAIELCEGLRLVSGQAALQVLPGVLAVGEQAGSSGRDILAAFVLGYDVAARIAGGFTPRALAHQNGQVPLLAAAAAGAKLRGLDAAGVSRAMRVATVLVLTPSYTNAVAGATALNVAGGMSGHAAALAPELALAGFEAQPDAIEESLGQLTGDGFKPDHVADDLGMSWHVTRNYFRLYACCNPIHPALDSLAAAPGGGRAHRCRDLPLRFRHAQPRPAELFRVEILAAACRRRDGRARRRRLCAARRQRARRSADRGVAPPRAYRRRAGNERARAKIASGARDRDAQRRPAGDTRSPEPSRRFQRAIQRGRIARQVPRARRHGPDPRRRGAGRSRDRAQRGLPEPRGANRSLPPLPAQRHGQGDLTAPFAIHRLVGSVGMRIRKTMFAAVQLAGTVILPSNSASPCALNGTRGVSA